MKHRSTKESILWSLHVCTSKNDATKGGTTPERRCHPIIRSMVSSEVAESGLELLHGDAFKKGTTQIAPPPPALAKAEGKFSPRSVRRDPTLVHRPPSPPAPSGRPWSTGRSASRRHHRIQTADHAGPLPSAAPSGSETKPPTAHRDRRREPSARHCLPKPTAARALMPPWSHQIGEEDIAR